VESPDLREGGGVQSEGAARVSKARGSWRGGRLGGGDESLIKEGEGEMVVPLKRAGLNTTNSGWGAITS